MILKYVSSYVSKWEEHTTNESLYVSDITGFEAANSFLSCMKPLEPEMVLQLSNIKIAWSNSRTKSFVAPTPEKTKTNTTYQKYLKRPDEEAETTFLQWLREYNESQRKPKKYTSGTTLVGVQQFSVFNPVFFFQHLLMNHPHTSEEQIHHSEEQQLPASVKYFRKATELLPELWMSQDAINSYFAAESHKSHYINTISYYINSLHDIMRLWSIRVIPRDIVDIQTTSTETLFPLSPQQQAIFDTLVNAVRARQQDEIEENGGRALSTTLPNQFADTVTTSTRPSTSNATVSETHPSWRLYHIILGKPGTGKSQVLKRLIDHCLTNGVPVMFASPIAILARKYSEIFGKGLRVETIHSAFKVPIDDNQQYSTNYSLNKYNVLVIDEASMISREVFNFIAATLNRMMLRPVVVIAGDHCQQPPLATVQGRTTTVTSVLNTFTKNAVKFSLYHQLRCVDPAYINFLNHIRYVQPLQDYLDRFQTGHVCITTDQPSEDQLWNALVEHRDYVVYTVSRAACSRINNLVLTRSFQEAVPICSVHCDSNQDHDAFPVYANMKVLVTQNRDKEGRVVNGQTGTVVSSENNTVLLRLKNRQLAFAHPVTKVLKDGSARVVYPFMPGYAVTICKCQGDNLGKVLLWLDCPLVPEGTAYVGLSRVKRFDDIIFKTPLLSSQLKPVNIHAATQT